MFVPLDYPSAPWDQSPHFHWVAPSSCPSGPWGFLFDCSKWLVSPCLFQYFIEIVVSLRGLPLILPLRSAFCQSLTLISVSPYTLTPPGYKLPGDRCLSHHHHCVRRARAGETAVSRSQWQNKPSSLRKCKTVTWKLLQFFQNFFKIR